jgi:hypothetical protein
MHNLICKLFHRLSWPRRDELGCYQACLVDGRRVPWRDPMPLASPHRMESASGGPPFRFRPAKESELESTQEPSARRVVAGVLQ